MLRRRPSKSRSLAMRIETRTIYMRLRVEQGSYNEANVLISGI
jgi:hypothetical protein